MSNRDRLAVKHGLMLAAKMEKIGADLPEPAFQAMIEGRAEGFQNDPAFLRGARSWHLPRERRQVDNVSTTTKQAAAGSFFVEPVCSDCKEEAGIRPQGCADCLMVHQSNGCPSRPKIRDRVWAFLLRLWRFLYFWKKAPQFAPPTSHQRSMLPAAKKSRKATPVSPSTLSDGIEPEKKAKTASDMGEEQFVDMLNSNGSPD